MTNPFESIKGGLTPQNPFESIQPPNPFESVGGSSATSQMERPGLGTRYTETLGQIVRHPVDAAVGMAKAVLFDALKATYSPVRFGDVVVPGPLSEVLPESLKRRIPAELNQPISQGEQAKALGLTVAQVALPATRSLRGAAALGAGIGAVSNTEDPALGGALGATLGPVAHLFGQGAAAIGRRAGLGKVAKSGAPLPESKISEPAPVDAVPARAAIRDMSNADVLDMTPTGIKIVAKQAAKEERALYATLFGTKGARRYRQAVRTSASADASPEAAAKALATMQSMYSELTPAQQTALDQVNSKGFTSRRLGKIAQLTKDYTPENLGKVVDEDLIRQFGEVLMSNKPDRNLAGLYRLRAIYQELDRRGVEPTQLLRGTYNYMLSQGVKVEGLGPMILGKMEDVRKTLTKVVPEKVTPVDEAVVGPLRQELGTVDEAQLQRELTETTPRPQIPVDEEAAARARVEAARTTPFPEVPVVQGPRQAPTPQPEIQTPISGSISEPLANIAAPLEGRLPKEPPGLSKLELDKLPRNQVLDLEGQTRQELSALGEGRKRFVYDEEFMPIADSPEAKRLIARLRYLGEYNYLRTKEIENRPDVKALMNKADQYTAQASRARAAGDEEGYVRALAQGMDLTSRAEQLMRGDIGSSGTAVEAVRQFAKDEAGSLNMSQFTDPLQAQVDMASLPAHSQNIQRQLAVPYDPNPVSSPLTPLQTLYRAITRQDVPAEGLRGAFVRRTAPLEKGEKAVQKAIGKKIPVSQLPSTVVQLLSGWAGKAEHFLKFGGFREVGGRIVETGDAGLQQIFDEAGDLNAFRRLGVAERVAELDAAGRKVETGIDPADARMEIANASPQTKAAVGKLHKYLDNVLQYAVDSGLLDPNVAAFLRQLGRAYVPLDRALAKGTKNLGNVQYAALSTAQQFRALIGNKLKIVDPLYSTVDYTRRIIRASELNKVGRALVEFVNAHPNETKGWLTRDKNVSASNAANIVASGQGLQQIAKQLGINIDLNTAKQISSVLGDSNLLVEGDIMRVRQGGDIHQYRVDPALGAMLRSLSPQQIEGWLRLAAAPSQALKIGVTANPVFGAFQAFVGAFQSKIQSKYGFRITQDPFIGLYHRLKKSPEYREALAAGGTSAYLSAAGRDTQSALRSIAPGSKGAKAIRSIAHPLEALRAVADPLEEMNRLGEYIRARRSGADVHEAALAMREVDTDFSMIGTQMAGLAHLVAFANPFIQAGDKAARTLAKSPQAWMSGLVGVTAPTVAFWLASEGDKEVRDLQRSDQGQRNWFLRLPKSGEIVKIPKPYLYGEIFANTAEAVMDQMERETPEQWATLAKGMRDNFTFLMLPTAAQTTIGAMSGKNPLGWNDIVPESRAGLEPSLQYTNQTTETARAIGDILNISPAKIDFAVQSLGGTLAREGMRSLDKLVPDGPATPPAPVTADLPLIGRFFARYPSEAVEPIRTFYKNAGDALVKLNTTRKYIDQMQPERAREYALRNRETLALADAYGKARQEFAEKRNLMEKIRDIPDNVMTPQTKRELTDQILTGMIESARAVNDAVRMQKKSNRQLQEATR